MPEMDFSVGSPRRTEYQNLHKAKTASEKVLLGRNFFSSEVTEANFSNFISPLMGTNLQIL